MTKRKGARSRADVSPEILRELNQGTVETATLSEALVIDFEILARNVGISVGSLEGLGILKRMRAVGAAIENWKIYASHPSDTVRGWAAFAVVSEPDLAFMQKLKAMRHFAADPHFGVREWAWLALRDDVAKHLVMALKLLMPWAQDPDPNIRRFASEVTRPRGVWCAHIVALKNEPERAQHILETLRADDSKYVRDSVANWLNDASKTKSEWVIALVKRWERESPCPETHAIAKRALRSVAQLRFTGKDFQ